MTLRELQRQVAQALTGTGDASFASAGLRADLVLAGELLVAKRRSEAAAWLPRTRQLLGSAFTTRFNAHARAYRPRGWNLPRDDAGAFVAALAADAGLPHATRDAARYEGALILAAAPGPFLLSRHLQHDPASRANTPGIHLWWRWHRRARLRHLRLPWG